MISEVEPVYSPAAERNQAPILATLKALLPVQGSALEIASGTGQHAAHFAAALPGWHWQPTDLQDTHFAAIATWAARAGARNVLPAQVLDVCAAAWPSAGASFSSHRFDLIYCANLLHIAPWACCPALMRGAARYLAHGGRLVTYGPYLEDATPTAPGNQSFDASLRAQDARWGIRRIEDVQAAAQDAGLVLAARHAMPANNLLLVWAEGIPEKPPSHSA